jgi:hypothetical protein
MDTAVAPSVVRLRAEGGSKRYLQRLLARPTLLRSVVPCHGCSGDGADSTRRIGIMWATKVGATWVGVTHIWPLLPGGAADGTRRPGDARTSALRGVEEPRVSCRPHRDRAAAGVANRRTQTVPNQHTGTQLHVTQGRSEHAWLASASGLSVQATRLSCRACRLLSPTLAGPACRLSTTCDSRTRLP